MIRRRTVLAGIAAALRRQTGTIPFVFVNISDPAGRRRVRNRSRVAAMTTKLRRAGRRSRYRLRKQIVEPVFGQIKAARGFRQFFLRGLGKVREEWPMTCTAHNLIKLAKAQG